MSRNRVILFLGFVLAVLAIVPIVNVISIEESKKTAAILVNKRLYNFDIPLRWVNGLLYKIGISTDSAQVVIGQDHWLYLGDRYEQTISVKRRGPVPGQRAVAQSIARAATCWARWLQEKGVRDYRVMLAPDKATVYRERLPGWAQPSAVSATDILMEAVGSERYVDLRGHLADARLTRLEPIYYRTDTHWNDLGAWVAFQAFGGEVTRGRQSIHWPSDRDVRIGKTVVRAGGDLARFLRLETVLSDLTPNIEIIGIAPIDIEQYEFHSGRLMAAGGNPQIATPEVPLLVRSRQALNGARVLWLRDSFGTALAPFMAATFTETLQMHWGRALENGGKAFAELVDAYRPDYVFVTVVERSALSAMFTTLPPAFLATGGEDFDARNEICSKITHQAVL